MTKTKILRAAKVLFAKNGYDGTSISDVLKKTEISKGALYHHFASKEDLFIETLIFSFAEKGLTLDDIIPEIKTKIQFKQHLLDEGLRMINFQIKHPQIMALKWELVLQMRKNPSLKKSAKKIRDTKMNNMLDLMKRGLDLGVFSNETNLEILLLKYILPLETIGLQIAFGDQKLNYREYWKKTVEEL